MDRKPLILDLQKEIEKDLGYLDRYDKENLDLEKNTKILEKQISNEKMIFAQELKDKKEIITETLKPKFKEKTRFERFKQWFVRATNII